MDIDFFLDMLSTESTSGSERKFADMLLRRLDDGKCKVSVFPDQAPDQAPVNLLFQWGEPYIVYCTHLDTVPPYIPPQVCGDGLITGRGTCDAKGQIISMVEACRKLADRGDYGFALLLLYGEETGSFGAKAMRGWQGADYLVVGEPTDNRMASASKGTKAFEVEVTGKSFHSGYPQYGDSAVERFVDIINYLRKVQWPVDPVLGDTTYNVGRLHSDNPQNILSDRLTFRVYFRTTFASDAMVSAEMEKLAGKDIKVTAFGGDSPSRYLTLPGFEVTTVAFGSDAPQLPQFKHKMLCGPGSILVAHTDKENINVADIEKATEIYIKIYDTISRKQK